MEFERLLEDYRKRFRHGAFSFAASQSIRKVVKEARVPAAPAVYTITTVGTDEGTVYIGKAGTMQQDGRFKEQLLSQRLCNRQDKMARQQYFQKLLVNTNATALHFEWFETFADHQILPAFAECELLQAFYNDHGRLPRCNRCI